MFSTDMIHKLADVPFLKDRREDKRLEHRAHDAPLFEIKVPRCEAYKRSVGYFGGNCWNNLPPNERNTATYPPFKRLQKVKTLNPLTLIDSED